MSVRCCFLDTHADFCRLLSAKLGDEFLLAPIGTVHLTRLEPLAGFSVLLVGLPQPDSTEYQDELVTLESAILNAAAIPVVAFLPCPDRQIVRDAIVAGAFDYFSQTDSIPEIAAVLRRAGEHNELRRELDRARKEKSARTGFGRLVSADPNMASLLGFASKIAATDATVLITGETGTGKEVLAHAIHEASARAHEPFLAVACSSLPETLIEAELFGHEKGAFTGAVSMRPGRFEAAQRGTIFFDENRLVVPGSASQAAARSPGAHL